MRKVGLEGQVAVVTGAARGVGELLARRPSARGAKAGRFLPGLLGTVGQREMRRFATRLEGVRTGLVGAGGAAHEDARATHRD